MSGDILGRDESSGKLLIQLPSDEARVRQLQLKKTEYEERLKAYAEDPETKDSIFPQSSRVLMKLAILDRLLEEHQVAPHNLAGEFAEQNSGLSDLLGPEEFERQWNTATLVVEDYCMTGGMNVDGGTGLNWS